MNNETIRLNHLSIGYAGKGGHTRTVATNIDGTIRQGELTCLLGANGIGKSTLLRTLSAFQPKLGGEILFTANRQPSTQDYKEITSLSDKELSRMIGVVLTEKPDVRNMSVRELVALGRSPYTGFWGTLHAEDWQVVDEAIDAIGITALKRRMIHTLSDGERQKVMIAKALAQQTPIIFLDEPTAFLDFPSKVEMMQLLKHLAQTQQKTIFLSTHDLELALQVANTLWLMERGEYGTQLNIGTPRQLASEGILARFVQRPGITFNPETMTVRIEELKN